MKSNIIIFLDGINISLSPLDENNLSDNYCNWLNDQSITAFNSHGRFPVSRSKLFEHIRSSNNSDSKLVLAVIFKNNNDHIGNISLQNINWIDRSAEIAFLLGEKNYWGTGIMFEAGKLLIDHGFRRLNLHRIYCGTSSANIGMQKLSIKLGLIQEGIRKEAIFKDGQYFDLIEYGIINNNKSL